MADRMQRQGHSAIRAALSEMIRARRWGPGDLMPTEAALAEHFGCARTTVNRALRDLASAGIVERRRRAGTRVLAVQSPDARLTVPLAQAEIEATGAAYRYELLAREIAPADAEAASALALPEGTPALRVLCRHFADDAPWQLERRWINLGVVPQAEAESFEARGPGAWLVETVPLTGARHEFGAVGAGAREARLLDVAPGAALFSCERRTWIGEDDARGRITWARLLHPGARYRMVAATHAPG